MTYLIRLSFVGTAYCGWQKQKNGPSVQEQVFGAVTRVFGGAERFSGCSRTDSGVHALDYCVSFSVSGSLPPEKVVAALNAYLPPDIAVRSAIVVPEGFHARYDVKQKTYLYRIDPSPVRSPFLTNRAWHRPGNYDLSLMNEAADRLVGTYDFSSFMAAGSKITDPVRTVYRAVFTEKDGLLEFSVSANGFLYHMVRIIVGTLVDVPSRFSSADLSAVLAARDRTRAGVTAPACGLYLAQVEY